MSSSSKVVLKPVKILYLSSCCYTCNFLGKSLRKQSCWRFIWIKLRLISPPQVFKTVDATYFALLNNVFLPPSWTVWFTMKRPHWCGSLVSLAAETINGIPKRNCFQSQETQKKTSYVSVGKKMIIHSTPVRSNTLLLLNSLNENSH